MKIVPLLIIWLLIFSSAHRPGRLHAQESTSALVDGWAVAVSGGRATWRSPPEGRSGGLIAGVHLGDYRPDRLGLEVGGRLLADRVSNLLLIDGGGIMTFPVGKAAALIRGGGFTALVGGGIGFGVYAGAGGLYLVHQNLGVTAELSGRGAFAGNAILAFEVGLVFGMD